MRSLFLKIFLWFWLTVVLVGVALVITWNLQPEVVVSRWRAMMGEAVAMYSQASAEQMDRYGQPSLDNYLQRLRASALIEASMFDENGTLISGRPSSEAIKLARLAVHSTEPQFTVTQQMAFAAHRSSGPSGRVYVLVAEMPRGPLRAFRPGFGIIVTRWAVAVLVSGFICYLLTLYLTAPILRLQTAARQIAAGNLDARAPQKMERRRDELGDLVRDFNTMAGRIESLVASQKQLISDMSHELRSPLARLTVALGLARQRAGSEASGQLDRIERESERLNDMIGKLLTLARLDSASAPTEVADVNLADLVREVVEDAHFEAQEHNCKVALVSQNACTVKGNPELLQRAIENVVRNAIHYTSENTVVEVSLACDSSTANITVRDHGPGVPEQELPKLFRPFHRVAGARERSTGGTGLGLAITERAVRVHGGTIRARNAEGEGLVVEMRIPAARA
ncbi:MAG TPA: ATP-binding protein [Terriglobales bacterium]|nr:ATP-binding protein [Terriglobales bacterium]